MRLDKKIGIHVACVTLLSVSLGLIFGHGVAYMLDLMEKKEIPPPVRTEEPEKVTLLNNIDVPQKDVDENFDWYMENHYNTGSALDILTRITFAESGNQSQQCMKTVAQVVINRVLSDKYPHTVQGVVYQNNGKVWQFVPAKTGSINNKPSEEAFLAAKAIWDGDRVCSEDVIAFDSYNKDKKTHQSWSDYVFTIGKMNFYELR